MTVRLLIVCGGSGKNLLGQRAALGLHGELYVDVGAEVRAQSQRSWDYYSQAIEVDRDIQTTGLVFQEARKWVTESRDDPDDRHLQVLLDYLPASVPLDQGLDMLPALGGLAIRSPQNKVALEQALDRMTAQLGVGPENPVEVWIVSSTVGGVGGGTRRFLGTFVADFVQRRYADTGVKLNFVCVEPHRSRLRNPRQAALNTLLGVAADSAFALSVSKNYPGVTTQWFYLNVVSSPGDPAVLVEKAVKSLMWEDLQKDLQHLVSYNRGIPMVLFQAGCWAREIDRQWMYYEILRYLRAQLQDLLEPEYEQKYLGGNPRVEFVARGLPEWLERVRDKQNLLNRLAAGWRFPCPKGSAYPRNLEELQRLVTLWKDAIQTLVGNIWSNLYGEWFIQEGLSREPLQVVEKTEEAPFGSDLWFQQLEQAHRARAWSTYLLGCDKSTGRMQQGANESRLNTLFAQAKQIHRLLHGFNLLPRIEVKTDRVADLLGEFVQTLAEVDSLLILEAKARHFLEAALEPVRVALGVTQAELEELRARWEGPDYSAYVAQFSGTPTFSPSDVLTQILASVRDVAGIKARVRMGWRVPFVWRFPTTLSDLRVEVDQWKRAIQDLAGVRWEWGAGGKFGVAPGETQGAPQVLDGDLDERDGTWARIESAHLVRAWARHLLGCTLQDGVPLRRSDTLVGQMRRQARRVALLWFLERIRVGSLFKQVTLGLSRSLEDMTVTLAKIEVLLNMEERSAQILDRELQKGSLFLCRGLQDKLDRMGRTTWLQELCESVRRPEIARFREVVLRGASGLTERGLQYVLNLSAGASVRDMHRELLAGMEEMKIAGAEGGLWARFCLLPSVPPDLQQRLSEMGREESPSVRYLFGFPDLLPIGLNGASMAREYGDTVSTPASVARAFAPQAKEVLSEWEFVSNYGVATRRLEIVSAGVGGEPLYEAVLRAIGLDDDDIRKLAEYYHFYAP